MPSTAREPMSGKRGSHSAEVNGAQGRNRTTDTVIFSHVLYQLSYLGAEARRRAGLVKARGYRGSVSGCPAKGKVSAAQAVRAIAAVIPEAATRLSGIQ